MRGGVRGRPAGGVCYNLLVSWWDGEEVERRVKVSTEQRADRQAVVQIEVEPAEMEQALERAYRRIVRQVNINGFRPGKAPRHIVERRLGKAVLLEEAAHELVPKLTSDAIKDHELDAIAEPQVEITALEPLTFTATVPLRPTVTLGDYTAIRVPPREINVTDEQVDEVIDRLRRQRGEWVTPEPARPPRDGDQVTIDLASSVGGEPLEAPQQDQVAVLGEPNGLLPELQEAIKGLNVGESTQVTVTFPEDSQHERVAGKEVVFDITLKQVKERKLPPLDEAFVKAVSDLDTVEALRARIRENLTIQARDTARQQITQAVIDLVTDQATIEMPPVLVDNQIERQLEERRQVFERQGLSWRRLLELTNRTEEQVREEERPLAERRVRSSLTLLEIAKREGITVLPEEVDAEIDRLVAGLPDPQAARRQYERPSARQAIESSLFEQKIIDRLVAIATEGRGYFAGPGEVAPPAALDEVLAAPTEDDSAAAVSAPGQVAAGEETTTEQGSAAAPAPER
jgi:trigger factor